MNSSGKVLTIFLVIIAILLISLTAISLFFFQKETERRKLAEATLEEVRSEKINLEDSLKEVKKQNFLLQEKNKEADERVNDLSDELELEKGLREEMKIETVALQKQIEESRSAKEKFAKEIKVKEELRESLTADLEVSKQKIKELEAQVKAEKQRAKELNELYKQRQDEMSELEKEASAAQPAVAESPVYTTIPKEEDYSLDEDTVELVANLGIELGEIVVASGEVIDGEEISDFRDEVPAPVVVFNRISEGLILSVDIETEFVIVSLGEMDGIEIGDVLSVYHDEDYVGDLRITRLQPEMSAADLIPPFSIKSVKKNDQVKAKQ
ncbi:MAG: hypothetical protein KAS66_02485 [Candidatus Omnitrophica bacterium]|nr:hypothetical protein [Candidatus Omnitrophota bacterium]